MLYLSFIKQANHVCIIYKMYYLQNKDMKHDNYNTYGMDIKKPDLL